jgi:hypothetical protein
MISVGEGATLPVSVLNASSSPFGASFAGRQPGQPVDASAILGTDTLSSSDVLGQDAFHRSCFAAGTPLLTPEGSKPIEEFRPGGLLLSRSENGPEEEVSTKMVEEVFVRTGRIMTLKVGIRVIFTTPEHPFWVRGQGWTPGGELRVGDELSTHDGDWVAVEAVRETGEEQTVYNLRVADFHTYFVGCEEWGFSVWAHNAECAILFQKPNGQWVLKGQVSGKVLAEGTEAEALAAAKAGGVRR